MSHIDLYSSLAHHLYNQKIPLRVIHQKHDSNSANLTFHSHDFIELVIVTDGSATHNVQLTNGKFYSYTISKGSVFMMNIGESHIYTFSPHQSIAMENIIFDPSILNSLNIKVDADIKYLDFIYLLPQLDPVIRFSNKIQMDKQSLQKLIVLINFLDLEQLSPDRPGSVSIQLMLLGIIISIICRLCSEIGNLPNSISKIKSTNILRVIGYIDQNYCDDISLNELTNIAICSERNLSRKFKAITGSSITAYIRNLRISKACHLLKNSEMKINEIAFRTGFNNCSFFIQVFKESTHMTPKEYRNLSH